MVKAAQTLLSASFLQNLEMNFGVTPKHHRPP